MTFLPTTLHTTDFPTLHLWRRGKVRDVYDLGDSLLFVATDRISAYDVVMNEPIPGKGAILTAISLFWFDALRDVVPNHIISADVEAFPTECAPYREQLRGRSMLVKKTDPLPIECVARGYLAGSGWREYRDHQNICGVELPEGLGESARLPNPIFTPATKAEEGHDMNITYAEAVNLIGEERTWESRRITLELYQRASTISEQRGIIIADTKFEFGVDAHNQLILIDEVLTPDSSRFWLASSYRVGHEQQNFDKQYLRDWLDSTDWNKSYPPPPLPPEVVQATASKYHEAMEMLVPPSCRPLRHRN